MSAGKLVMMANQIGKFHVSQRRGDPAAAIADHLRRFWDPGMRLAIVAHLDRGGEGLDDAVRQAVRRLADSGSAKTS